MVALSLSTAFTVLSLTLAGVSRAAPAGTPTERSAGVVWPPNAAVFKRNIQTGNTDTNAKRLASGLPLKAPARRSLNERYNNAPAQASGTTNAEIFDYYFCASGGFSYHASYQLSGTYATSQEQVNACAEQSEIDQMTVFAVTSSGLCYTGAQSIGNYMEACTSSNYAVYMYD